MKIGLNTAIHCALIMAQCLIPAFTPMLDVNQHAAIAGCIALLQGALGYYQNGVDKSGNKLP